MVNSINFSRHTIKGLAAIHEPYFSKIKTEIVALSTNPKPIGYKKLKGENAYKIRIGDYRVIYEILDEILIIELIDIGHRKNIYK